MRGLSPASDASRTVPLTRIEPRSTCDLSPQAGRGERKPGCRVVRRLVPTPPMAEKPKKPQKLKARLPRGLEDRGPAAIAGHAAMVEKIRAVYERYGFEPVETPAMEYHRRARKIPARPGPAQRGRVLVPGRRRAVDQPALRPDRAAGALCRGKFRRACQSPIAAIAPAMSIATRSRARAASASSCSSMPTRWASASPAADAEMCMMAADTMEALGIPRGSYVVKVNNRKVLDGVMESDRARRRGECRATADRAARDRQAR